MDRRAETAAVPALFSAAAHPGYVNRAVLAHCHAGKIVFFGVFLHCVDCGLLPSGTAIGGVRGQNLALAWSEHHYCRDIQAIDPWAAHVSIHGKPRVALGGVTWLTHGHGWLAPVEPVG